MRPIRPGETLGEQYPELARELHPTRNLGMTYYGVEIHPSSLSSGSRKRVWWLCPNGPDHEWETTIANRTSSGSGCPFCSNQRVCQSNCLQTVRPDFAEQWDFEANYPDTPNSVHVGSTKKFWWTCSVESDHRWKQSPNVRHHQSGGCPFCSGKRVCKSNSLATVYPEIASEWHPTKNGKKTPEEYTAASGARVWWRCEVSTDHEWRTSIAHRTVGKRGCPCCSTPIKKVVESNCLDTTHPDIAAELLVEESGFSAHEISAGSQKKALWRCAEGHTYRAAVCNRTNLDNLTGCPYCSNQKIAPDNSNSLGARFPNLVTEWSPNNSQSPFDVFPGTTKKTYSWICAECDFEWNATVASRALAGTGCPVCANKQVHPDGHNSMANTHPEIADELMPNEFGDMHTLVAGFSKKLPWKCSKCGHEWKASGHSRAKGHRSGCRRCAAYGVQIDKPCSFYILAYHGPTDIWWWKTGVSNDVVRRMRQLQKAVYNAKMPLTLELVGLIEFQTGADALKLEKHFLDSTLVRSNPRESFDGSTELFAEDPRKFVAEYLKILGRDNHLSFSQITTIG